jgi:hypothetical protein
MTKPLRPRGAGAGAAALQALPKSFQEFRDQVVGQPEAIGAQLHDDGSSSLEHTHPSRTRHDPESTNHGDSPRQRDGSAIMLIDQQCVRAKLLSQENCSRLACVQAESLNGRILNDLDPRGRLESGDNVRTSPLGPALPTRFSAREPVRRRLE